MSKYIDAEKLKTEITRLKGQLIRGACAPQIVMETNCKDEAYDEVLASITYLQQEQPEVDLKKEVKEYIKKNFTITDEIAAIPEKDKMYSMGSDDLLYLAYYFIRLELNARKEK